MILRPLCISDDLGTAVAYAYKHYSGIAGGHRPAIVNRTCRGERDTFVVRFLIGLTESADVVQILLVDRKRRFAGSGGMVIGGEAGESLTRTKLPQVITITVDEWTFPLGVEDSPFFATCSHDLAPNVLPIGATGTLTGTGGGSGNPVILTSVNTAVATVSGSTITIVGYGIAQFYLDQAGDDTYLPADRLIGGEHIIRDLHQYVFTGSGGMVCGGQARVTYKFKGYGGMVCGGEAIRGHRFTGSGGMVCGGQARVKVKRKGYGGMVCGGQAIARLTNAEKPVATPLAYNFFYSDLDSTFLKVYPSATAKRGGTLTYEVYAESTKLDIVPAVDAVGKPIFKVYKLDHYWVNATTYFTYIAIETTEDGIAVPSVPATVTIDAKPPATMAYSLKPGVPNHFYWTGGAYPFTLSLTGTYSGTVVLVETNIPYGYAKEDILMIGGDATSSSGYVKITDHYGNNLYIPLTTLGVPTAPNQLQIDFSLDIMVGEAKPISFTRDSRGGNLVTFSSANTGRIWLTPYTWLPAPYPTYAAAYSAGPCDITMTQQGANGLPTKSITKTITVTTNQPPPKTWSTVQWGCGWYGTANWDLYMQGPNNVVYSPDGTYRLTWRIIKPEYFGGFGTTNSGHSPTSFAEYLFGGTATYEQVLWTYSHYFWPYSIDSDPAVDSMIHWGIWEHAV